MWFKQIQLFRLTDTIAYSPDYLMTQLDPLAFIPCLPSMPTSAGWVPPLDDEGAPLVHAANGRMMLCMQVEEKILPATVVRQALYEKIKKIELAEDRKVRQKEKLTLKDEMMMTLLPRAFSKLTRLYAYIDTQKQWLVVGTTNAGKAEQFVSLLKKSIGDGVRSFEVNKPSPIMTHWLKNQSYPTEISVEKSAVLQDPQQQNRVIRCQQQDLFASSIQSLIKDGCEVKQLALCWQDRVNFVLADDFSLRSIQYQEDVLSAASDIETETRQQQFDADFFIMTETLDGLFSDLLKLFVKSEKSVEANAA
jgi:recombination associated protein RdgC